MRPFAPSLPRWWPSPEGYAGWIAARPWTVIALVLALAGAAAAGASRLTFDASYQAYFSERNPQLQAYLEFQDVYSKTDLILIALAPEDGEVFTRRTLAAVEWLTEQAWQIPYSRRVDSVVNFQHTRAEGDELIVEPLVQDAATLGDAALERVRDIALAEPLLRGRLVAPDAAVTGVAVTVQLPERASGEAQEAVEHVRALERELVRRFPGIDVYLSGGIVMDVAFPEATLADLETLVPLVYAVIVITMAVLLRSVWATVAVVLIIALSAATGMGMAGWLGMRLTPPSVGATTIIMTLAVADSIHILVILQRELAQGRDRLAALAESLRTNLQPVFLTSLTTAIGFLSMNYSDAPPFNDLGNITAMGVVAAFVYSVLLLPALIMVVPLRAPAPGTRRGRAMERLADLVVPRRRAMAAGMAALCIALAAFVPRIELDDQFIEYFDESLRFRADTEFVIDRLTGIAQLEYSLESGEPGGIARPDFLARVAAFTAWLAAQPEVRHVESIVPVLERLNMNLHGDDPAWQRLPAGRDLAAQYLLLYEMSLPYGLDLNDRLDIDKSATRVTATVQRMSTRRLRELEARADAWLDAHLPPYTAGPATGPVIMFAYIAERNIRTMLIGTALAVLLIAATLVVALRSLRFGLISLVPNVIPAVMALGFWGLTVGRVGLVVSVVSAMALGIIVDDSVHFISKYLHGRRHRGLSPEDAVRYAFRTVGTALWVTSAIIMAGFLLLALSTFELNETTGLLVSASVGFALLADFLLLPPLLMWVDRETAAPRGGRGGAGVRPPAPRR